jgi:hypothetical protein
MSPIIKALYLPQMLGCGFILSADMKENRETESLSFEMNRSLGEGFCRVYPIGGCAAVTAMDIVYHRETEIVYPQPDCLHLGLPMGKTGALFGHVGRGETYRMVCACGERVCSVGVSLLPEFYEEHMKTRYGISPELLTKAVSELDGFVAMRAEGYVPDHKQGVERKWIS